MRRRFWRNIIFTAILGLLIVIWGTDYWVTKSTRSQLYSDASIIPKNKVGLLLGTSKYLSRGVPNPYYSNRIEAAVTLFRAGKIQYILVSGDSSKHYNEPEKMKKDLLSRNIPPDRIVTDYAGVRTLNSVVRCKEVFGEDSVTIISQLFHNERALFIANHEGIKAIAFNAGNVDDESKFIMLTREKFARVKMLLDLIFNTQPRYNGARVIIG